MCRVPYFRCALLTGFSLGAVAFGPVKLVTAKTEVSVLAMSNRQAPGTTAGTVFNTVVAPAINDSGTVAFTASLKGPPVQASSDNGIWIANASETSLVIREGETPPGLPASAQYEQLSYPSLNSAGTLAFIAFLRGFDSGTLLNHGIFRRTAAGAQSLVAHSGIDAPSGASGEKFDYFSFTQPVGFSDSGVVAFDVTFTTSFGEGLYRGEPGSLTMLARNGSAAPSGLYTGFGAPFLSGNGNMIFEGATTFGAGAFGIWTISPSPSNTVTLIARQNMQVPGLPNGVVYNDLDLPTLTDNGLMAFDVILTGTGVNGSNDRAVISNRGGPLTNLVRSGEPAADTPAGVVYANFQIAAINSAGQVVFLGGLAGNGVTSSNNLGLWLVDSNGTHLLVRTGDTLDLGAMGEKTLSDLDMTRAGFADQGVAALRVKFTSGEEAVLKLSLVANAAPTLKLKGSKSRTVGGAKTTVRGTATGDSEIVRVEWKGPGQRKFKKAKGTDKWRFSVRLEPGPNRVQVRAIDADGLRSKLARLKITRR